MTPLATASPPTSSSLSASWTKSSAGCGRPRAGPPGPAHPTNDQAPGLLRAGVGVGRGEDELGPRAAEANLLDVHLAVGAGNVAHYVVVELLVAFLHLDRAFGLYFALAKYRLVADHLDLVVARLQFGGADHVRPGETHGIGARAGYCPNGHHHGKRPTNRPRETT